MTEHIVRLEIEFSVGEEAIYQSQKVRLVERIIRDNFPRESKVVRLESFRMEDVWRGSE